tara:strand:+ start:1073 stop:2122 length:1050 start_codon:yes stop_codon:yes gene_type:complete
MKSIKNIIKKILLVDEGPKPLFSRKLLDPLQKISKDGFDYCQYGNLNKDKTFYVINRSSHAGIFSYLSFVLNHLLIAKQYNFIPVVDMQNFTNPYNEIDKIHDTLNSWEYYFEQTSNYDLSEVYSSKNVIFSRNDFNVNMSYRIHLEPKFNELKKKEIRIKQIYNDYVNDYFKKNNLENKKILGIHFRGTSYKTSRGHIFPATIDQMKQNVDKILLQEKFDKIFLCSEEKNYLDFFIKNYSDKLLYLDTYRSDQNDAFKKYNRKNHRYLLGDESIKEALILSNCSSLLFVRSNIINAANFFSDKEQNLYEIFNGFNSRNQFISRFLWFIKKNLPTNFYGLKGELLKSKN